MRNEGADSIGKRLRTPEAAPGSYSRAAFARALGPLWKAHGFDPDDRTQVVRAGLIAERLYGALGHIMPLEVVSKMAEDFADDVEAGSFPNVSDFLPDRSIDVILRYAKSHSTTMEELRELGYAVRRARR